MVSSDQQEYDFIVIGGGTAGCYIASEIARSTASPRVLLVEAGGDNSDPSWRAHRNMTTQITNVPQNWNYKSVPLSSANNRQVSIDRGKGLGGSTAINFTYWTRGARDEWDEMARLVGDDDWKWENAVRRYQQLEGYYDHAQPGSGNKYYNVPPNAYGKDGPIRICSPTTHWDADLEDSSAAWEACGYRLNPDMSAGDPLGVVMSPLSGYDGVRSTAADLLLQAPENLHILTDSPVHKVLFNGTRANGISLFDGKVFHAAKEIILSAGTVDTPKILLHSGIGPADALVKLGIPIVYENNNVGQTLRDHYHVTLLYTTEDDSREGKSTLDTGGHTLGFFKLDNLLSGSAFDALPRGVKRHLSQPTVPTFEMAHRGGRRAPVADVHKLDNEVVETELGPPTAYMVLFVVTGQGKGEVTLQSTDPTTPPLIRPSYLEHPWDKKVAIEATRTALKILDHPTALKSNAEGVFQVLPKSDSEEDILEFWKQNLASTWHMTSSCKMGKSQEEDEACVDPEFKVFGVKGLRVADASVLPLLPTVHTQAHAYQTGMLGAHKIISEYGLNN